MNLRLCVLIGLIGTCCNQKTNTDFISRAEPRRLFVFGLDSSTYEEMELRKTIDYKVTIQENDSIKVFRYFCSSDSTKNQYFKLLKGNRRLIWGLSWESMIKDSLEVTISGSKQRFYLYENIENIIDGPSRLYFNDHYGILNIANLGSEYLYLAIEDFERAEDVLNVLVAN